jgi:hypothetical protein
VTLDATRLCENAVAYANVKRSDASTAAEGICNTPRRWKRMRMRMFNRHKSASYLAESVFLCP